MSKVASFLRVVPVLATYYVIERNVFSISNADGQSMEPTIKSGDIVVIDRLFYRWQGLKPNDIVVAVQPVNPEVSICKRILAVGGEKVPSGPAEGIMIPNDQYWLEGDNRSNSYDSRHHGAVSENLIQGRVALIIPV